MQAPAETSNDWLLNPRVDFLNHGSFGAMPRVVWERQRQLIESLEFDPIEFLGPERSLLPKLDAVRKVVARLVGTSDRNLAFVRNATDGVNAVLRSFPFSPGDEIIVTNHGYNACNNAVKFAAKRAGANVAIASIPFPIRSPQQVVDRVYESMTDKTRLILIDHVTSPTGLVFPIEEVIGIAHDRGVRVFVDGAHAPGMLPVDIDGLGADYYTANHHKWLCGPKTSGFLFVRPEFQGEVRPTVISHGANSSNLGDSQFLAEFNWIGTYDPTPLLCVPFAFQFLETLCEGGLSGLMSGNRAKAIEGRNCLVEALPIEPPAPSEMLGSLAAIVLPGFADVRSEKLDSFQRHLFHHHKVEVPIFRLNDGTPCLRISAQAYNSAEQYHRLGKVLQQELRQA